MSQSIIAQPQTFLPAYNPTKFIVDSTNSNATGFKYIFQVFDLGTGNKVAEYKTLPLYSTGYGEIDLSKLLQTQVSWDLDTTSTSWYDAPNSIFSYHLEVGEEQVAEYPYTASLITNAGNTEITATNVFIAGDQVVITQADLGVANPLLEGLHTIVSATGSSFTVNVAFSSITDITIDGTVKYADNRKVITYNVTTFSARQAYNAAFRWVDWSVYDENDYDLTISGNEWLTNQPSEFSATLGQDIYLNVRNPYTTDDVYFVNSNSAIFYKSLNNSGSNITQIPVGPYNFGALTGVGQLIDNTVTYYDIYYQQAGSNNSVTYRINLDRRTSNTEYQILFLDRMGSFSSFAFQLKSYDKGEVTREIYNKDVEGYVTESAEWNYNTEEMGFTQLNLNVVKSLDLNTNFMSEADGQYFEELITSPMTFIREVNYTCGDTLIATPGTYQPCIVQNNQYEVFQQRNKNLIKQSITVKLSNQDNING